MTRVYGPYRRANCFLRDAIVSGASGAVIAIPCDPDFSYHYAYVDDVVGAINAVLTAKSIPHSAYNVTSGEVLSMPEIAATLTKLLPSARLELVPGKDDAPEVQDRFSLDLMKADFGWVPAFSLARGLSEYVAAARRCREALN